VFFSDGTQHIKGAYKNDLRDGLWEYFNEDGSSKIKIDYKDGKIVNEDEFEKAQTKLINEEYIEQEGKHIDPQDFLDNPEAYIFGTQNAEEQAPTPKAKKKKEKSKK
jgi:antitoxin component YwqK of YwqJK toxin-antitoxin module